MLAAIHWPGVVVVVMGSEALEMSGGFRGGENEGGGKVEDGVDIRGMGIGRVGGGGSRDGGEEQRD